MADFAQLVISAQTTGLKTGVTDLDKLTKAAMTTEDQVQDAMAGIAVATGKIPPATKAMAQGFSLGGHQAKMMGMQLSQVGQQTMASGNFIQALAIQLPDLGLAFGTVGMAAGLLAGIALPLVANMFGSTGAAAETLDERLEGVTGALRDFNSYAQTARSSAQDLREEFGQFAESVRQTNEWLAKVAVSRAIDGLTTEANEFAFGMRDVNEAMAAFDAQAAVLADVEKNFGAYSVQAKDASDLLGVMGAMANESADALGLTAEQARQLSAEMASLGAATEMADIRDGAADVLALLEAMFPAGQGMSAALAAAAEELNKVKESAERGLITMEGMPSTLGASSAAASNLAGALANAAGQASALAAYMGALPGALAGFQAQAHAASAGIAAMKLGFDAAAVSAAEFRGQQEAAAGMLTVSEGPGMKAAAAAVDTVVAAYEGATAITTQFRDGQAAAAKAMAEAASAAAGGGGGGAAGAVEALTNEMIEAKKAAEEFAATIQGPLEDAVDGFADWVASGFDGGFDAMLDEFKSTWSDLLQHAIMNPIETSLFGAPAVAGVGGAPDTAAMPGLLGDASSGFMGGVNASLGSGFGNIFNLSANVAAAGGGLGATLGALVGPIGILFGLFSAFQKTVVNLDAGLQVTISDMGVLAEEFSTNKTTSFFGLFSSTKTTTNAVDAETQAQLDAIFQGINDSITGSAEALGIGAAALDTFAYDFDVSLKGLSDEEAARAMEDAFGGMSDAMAELVLAGTGVTIPLEGAAAYLDTLATSLIAVNSANKMLGFTSLDTSVEMGVLSEKIVAVYGSIEEFTAATGFYFDNFYSREEQIAALSTNLEEQMQALNRTTPETMESFRAMVDAAEAAGNEELAAGLIDLSDEFVNLQLLAGETATIIADETAAAQERYDLYTQLYTLQGKTDQLRARELELLDPTNAALQEQIWALEDTQAAALEAAAAADELARAAEELAQAEAATAQERYDLYTELYTLQGKTDQLRARELEQLDPTNAALQEQIWALEDLQAASEEAALAAEELAAQEAETAQERYDLYTELYTLQGKTDQLRARELALLDPTNQAIQMQIWALEDLQAATDAAALAADELAAQEEATAQERYDLYTELYTLQGKTDQLRARELELLDPTNAAIQEQIWALEDLQAAEEAAAVAADELAQAEQAIADERMSLQRELWTLQGDMASLRADELAALDESNRALQEQIWLLEDQKAALDALDPNAYSTLFEFQRDSALAANGYMTANANYAPAAPPQLTPVQTTTSTTDPVVIALGEVKAAIQLMQVEQRDLNMQTANNTLSIRNLNTKWDGDALNTRTVA